MRWRPFGIYIDNSNLLNLLKENTGNLEERGEKIDYGKLCAEIEKTLNLKRKEYYLKKVRIYDGIVINDEEKKKRKEGFLRSIENKIKRFKTGVDFKYYLVKVAIGKQHHLKGDDIALAVDLTYDLLKKEIDLGIVVSADGDFWILKEKFGDKIKFAWIRELEKGLNKRLRGSKPIWIGLEAVKLVS